MIKFSHAKVVSVNVYVNFVYMMINTTK